MNVLLIEPDKKLALIYKNSIEAAGHVVASAAHAQQAIHAADTFEPDVVVLELQLAAHNGIEFIYEFRSYNEWASVPVILLTMVTPSSLQITKEMMSSLGIEDILYKPETNLRQLTDAIEQIS